MVSFVEDEEEQADGAPTPRIDPVKKFLTPAEQKAKEHKEQALFLHE